MQNAQLRNFLEQKLTPADIRQLRRIALDAALPITKNTAVVDEGKELVQALLNKLGPMLDAESLQMVRDTLKAIAPDAVADLDLDGTHKSDTSSQKQQQAMDAALSRAHSNFSERWPSVSKITVAL